VVGRTTIGLVEEDSGVKSDSSQAEDLLRPIDAFKGVYRVLLVCCFLASKGEVPGLYNNFFFFETQH
jgi:hypothetical protein